MRAKSNYWNPVTVYGKRSRGNGKAGGRTKKLQAQRPRKGGEKMRWTILIFIGGIPRIFGSEKTDGK